MWWLDFETYGILENWSLSRDGGNRKFDCSKQQCLRIFYCQIFFSENDFSTVTPHFLMFCNFSLKLNMGRRSFFSALQLCRETEKLKRKSMGEELLTLSLRFCSFAQPRCLHCNHMNAWKMLIKSASECLDVRQPFSCQTFSWPPTQTFLGWSRVPPQTSPRTSAWEANFLPIQFNTSAVIVWKDFRPFKTDRVWVYRRTLCLC